MSALKESLGEAMGKFSPDRTVLPIPDPNFAGTVGRTIDASVADWTINMTPSPPAGAPNVLLVLIDDAGFGNPSTFGGPVSTPAMTRVGGEGLTYNRFHVTALCSPSRAALLTGRNHHTVGFGMIGEFPGPFPGYSANVPKDCAPFVRALQGNGYSTAGFGKWHLTPDRVQGAAGPFDRWPNAWGFDHFWGILGGEAGQYDPVITQDNTTLGVPNGTDTEQYYWPDDLTDQAMGWLHEVRAQDAEKPWFVYYSTGCSHAPHQVAVEWSEKYRGKFDQGWDVLREETFERQKKLGVIPSDAMLTPRPDALPAWDSLSDGEKKLYARQMEVYAGFQENADWNVGRLLDAVAEMGELDNTLVIYIFGDNGASLEGTLTGSFNELTMQNGIALTAEQQLSLIDQYGGLDAWGTDASAPHYASAWAWAGNTPFQWGKQCASHLGGTRNGMVIACAGADQGRRLAHPVHSRDRHRADDPRGGRHPRAQGRGRDRPEADGGDELPPHLRGRERTGAPHRAVLRDRRQPGDLQGRLVGRLQGGPDPVGHIAADDGEVRTRSLRPRAGHVGSSTTSPTTSRRRTTSPRRTRRSSPS